MRATPLNHAKASCKGVTGSNEAGFVPRATAYRSSERKGFPIILHARVRIMKSGALPPERLAELRAGEPYVKAWTSADSLITTAETVLALVDMKDPEGFFNHASYFANIMIWGAQAWIQDLPESERGIGIVDANLRHQRSRLAALNP